MSGIFTAKVTQVVVVKCFKITVENAAKVYMFTKALEHIPDIGSVTFDGVKVEKTLKSELGFVVSILDPNANVFEVLSKYFLHMLERGTTTTNSGCKELIDMISNQTITIFIEEDNLMMLEHWNRDRERLDFYERSEPSQVTSHEPLHILTASPHSISMPVPHYGIWVATPTSFKVEREDADARSPHIYLKFKNNPHSTRQFSAAINVKSVGPDSRLIYWHVNNLKKDFTDGFKELGRGFHPIDAGHGLDYVRSQLVDFAEGELLEYDAPWPDNDIIDQVAPILRRAIKSDNVTVYIFGSQFPHHDGIHDIHMNQGSLPQFDNGVGQDGGIVLHYTDEDRWEAIFLAFASQKIPTDEKGLPKGDARELVALLGPQAA